MSFSLSTSVRTTEMFQIEALAEAGGGWRMGVMRSFLRPSGKGLFENHCKNEPLVYKNDLFLAPVWGGTSNRGSGGGWRRLANGRLRLFLRLSGKGLFEKPL